MEVWWSALGFDIVATAGTHSMSTALLSEVLSILIFSEALSCMSTPKNRMLSPPPLPLSLAQRAIAKRRPRFAQ